MATDHEKTAQGSEKNGLKEFSLDGVMRRRKGGEKGRKGDGGLFLDIGPIFC